MNKKKKIILTIVLFGLLVTACSTISPARGNDLENTQWQLLSIRKSSPLAERLITITFKDGQVNGSSGCNSYFGTYSIKGNEISFGPLATTEMACMTPEGIMQQEQEYLTFLSEVVTYSVQGNQLILNKEGQDQLTFQKSTNE